MKMCDNFCRAEQDVTLFLHHDNSNYNEIKQKYNLRNNFTIKSVLSKKIILSFLTNLFFAIKILGEISKVENISLILSRSIVSSIILSLFGRKNVLEIHHEILGVTKFFYLIMDFLNFTKNINYIFLNKSLISKFNIKNKKYICLDDAIDLKDFESVLTNKEKFNNRCLYIGSFYKGKSLEVIYNLANRCPNIIFDLYGDTKNLEIKKNFNKNIRFNNYISYSYIPDLISKYKISLMPYQTEVSFSSKKMIDISKSMSPLKMFDYLASNTLLLATDLDVYKHILKNGFNCFLFKENDFESWAEKIIEINNNFTEFNNLINNANKTVKKYTWENRVKKILECFT